MQRSKMKEYKRVMSDSTKLLAYLREQNEKKQRKAEEARIQKICETQKKREQMRRAQEKMMMQIAEFELKEEAEDMTDMTEEEFVVLEMPKPQPKKPAIKHENSVVINAEQVAISRFLTTGRPAKFEPTYHRVAGEHIHCNSESSYKYISIGKEDAEARTVRYAGRMVHIKPCRKCYPEA